MITCVRRSLCCSPPFNFIVVPLFCMVTRFEGRHGPVFLVNVHMHPHWSGANIDSVFFCIAREVAEPGALVIMGGDFNFVLPDEFRLNLSIGARTREYKKFPFRAFDKLFRFVWKLVNQSSQG